MPELINVVRNQIENVGSYYGRRTMTVSLRANGVRACEVRQAMMAVDPTNHVRRQTDSNRRFNAVPYNAQYFGHKIHVDLNEKLIHFGCGLVGAIDGYSGFIISLFTIHRKNVVDVAQMYKDIIEQHGVWDQIRVDPGREFNLMCYL